MANAHAQDANPFDLLIDETNDKPKLLQSRYEQYRSDRNEQQRQLLSSSGFQGFNIDPILSRLISPKSYPGFADPRHCIVLWARPPKHIQEIVAYVQDELRAVAPNLWMMPAPNLHATVMEIVHSKTEGEIAELRQGIESSVATLTDLSNRNRTRLIKPLVSFDASALALSFVPAAGEPSHDGAVNNDEYSYHHLRKDTWDRCRDAELQVASRYVVPSAHLTIARFISQTGFEKAEEEAGGIDLDAVRKLLEALELVNQHLRAKYWPNGAGNVPETGEWWVGKDVGLTLRSGKLWYGGGETMHVGKGF